MMHNLRILLLFFAMVPMVAIAGQKTDRAKPVIMKDEPVDESIPSRPAPPSDFTTLSPASVGTYTTLEGFYDYQSNGGALQYIRVDPTTGDIHVIYMLSTDSANANPFRRTGYAYSTNDGATWNNFGNVQVPTRRSGFPSLDLGKGGIDGAAIIANHALGGFDLETFVHVDFPAGGGAFSELPSQGNPGGRTIWPAVTGASDGSIVVHSSDADATAGSEASYIQRTTDYSTWSPWLQHPLPNDVGGRYVAVSTPSGKVGIVTNVLNGVPSDAIYLLESTNNGASWPGSAMALFPDARIVGGDTLTNWVGCDLAYMGDDPLVVVNSSRRSDAGGAFFAGSRVEFWSAATGYVDAVKADTNLYPTSMVPQTNHLALGYPSIGISGNRIVVVFMAFLKDTTTQDTATGFLNGEIFMVQSLDGGFTWSYPVNLTNTKLVDERYPSVAKWNPAGYAYIVWQEDPQPGSSAFNDNAPVTRAKQVFLKLNLDDPNAALAVTAGWNMISNPVTRTAGTDSVRHLFPSAAFPYAFGFAGASGYQQQYIMQNGKGYWEKFPEYAYNLITGGGITSDTIDVEAGWNMVGSITLPLDTADIISIPPGIQASAAWFGYNNGYVNASHIFPGKAYWVKTNQAGQFVFSAPPAAPARPVQRRSVLDNLNTITIRDASGTGQTLYFGADLSGEIAVSAFEMPPPPPAGVLDARFETAEGGFMVQTHDGTASEFTIALSASAYPLTVTWDVKDEFRYQLRAGSARHQTLSGSGSFQISSGSVNHLSLALQGKNEIPVEFALEQNYPNPFNPSTTIGFALPTTSNVTVEIYNVLGQKVRTLLNEVRQDGYHTIEWNGTSDAGQLVGSGIYFLKLNAAGSDGVKYSDVRKLMMLK